MDPLLALVADAVSAAEDEVERGVLAELVAEAEADALVEAQAPLAALVAATEASTVAEASEGDVAEPFVAEAHAGALSVGASERGDSALDALVAAAVEEADAMSVDSNPVVVVEEAAAASSIDAPTSADVVGAAPLEGRIVLYQPSIVEERLRRWAGDALCQTHDAADFSVYAGAMVETMPDALVNKFCDKKTLKFLGEQILANAPLMSNAKAGGPYGFKSKAVGTKKLRFHASLFHIERQRVLHMLSSASQRCVEDLGGRALRLTEWPAQDATPVSIKALSVEEADLAFGGDVPAGADAVMVYQDAAPSSKVVFKDLRYSMCFANTSFHALIVADVPATLSAIDRGTGEVFAELGSEARLDIPVSVSSRFKTHDRVPMQDRAGDGARGERGFARRAGIPLSLRFCRQHEVADVAKLSLNTIMSEDISGMYHLTKALDVAGSLPAVRKIAVKLLCKRVVSKHGAPPEAAERHRHAMLDRYLPLDVKDPKSLLMRATVERAANGDIRANKLGRFILTALSCQGRFASGCKTSSVSSLGLTLVESGLRGGRKSGSRCKSLAFLCAATTFGLALSSSGQSIAWLCLGSVG